ncbi:MAG: hypothetical protein CNLJKLNK_00995 [Holosporales bacterium]
MLFKLRLIKVALLTTPLYTHAMQPYSVPIPSYKKVRTTNFSPYNILSEQAGELAERIQQSTTKAQAEKIPSTLQGLLRQKDDFRSQQNQLCDKLQKLHQRIEAEQKAYLALKAEHQKKFESHTKKYDDLYLRFTEKMDMIEKSIHQLSQPSIEKFQALKAQIKTLERQSKSEKVKIAELEKVVHLLKNKVSQRYQNNDFDEGFALHEHQLDQLNENATQIFNTFEKSFPVQDKSIQEFKSTHMHQFESVIDRIKSLKRHIDDIVKKMTPSQRTRACQTDAIVQPPHPERMPRTQHAFLALVTESFKLDSIMPKIFDNAFFQESYFYSSFMQENKTFLETLHKYVEKIAEQNEKESLLKNAKKAEFSVGIDNVLEKIMILYEGTKNPDAHAARNGKYAQFLLYTWINLRNDNDFTLLNALQKNIFPRIDQNFKEVIICSILKILFSIAKTIKGEEKKENFISALLKNHNTLTDDIFKGSRILNFGTYSLLIDFFEFLSSNQFKLNGKYLFDFIKIYSLTLNSRCMCAIIANPEYKMSIAQKDMKIKHFFLRFALSDILLKEDTFTENDLGIICDAIKTLKYSDEPELSLEYLKVMFTQKTFNVTNVRAIMKVCEISKLSDFLIKEIEHTATPEEKQNYINICQFLERKK